MNLLKRAQTALEQGVIAGQHDETVLQQSRLWMRAITWGLIGTAGFALAWLALAQTEEIVVAQGKLQPIGSVKEIQMAVGGIAEAILVKEGEKVKAGQMLMQLDTEASTQKHRSLQDNLGLKRTQLGLKQLELQRFQRLNRDSVGTLAQKVAFQKEILDRLSQLVKVGASAELQYLQQRNTVQETEGQLRETRLDGLRQEAILQQQIQQLRSELSELQSQLIETGVTLRYQALRSPVDGIVFDLKAFPGYAAQSTEAVMKVVPFNALEAKVEIPSGDIGFVRQGMPVDISIDSFPATDFGVLAGTVRQMPCHPIQPNSNRTTASQR
jgi:hemolysin D